MNSVSSRRNFFKNTLRFASLALATNAGVYLIGSAFKGQDGSLTAGAKAMTWQYEPCFGMYTDYNNCWICGFYQGDPCNFGMGSCILQYGGYEYMCQIGQFWSPSGGDCLVCR